MRVLLATGVEDLDREICALLEQRGIEVIGECGYREGIFSLLQDRKADVVVVSPKLSGTLDIASAIYSLRREKNVRVILLPGRRDDPEADGIAKKAVSWGVYDLVWDLVTPAGVVHRILAPATLADVGIDPDTNAIQLDGAVSKKESRQRGFLGKLSQLLAAKDKARRGDIWVVTDTDVINVSSIEDVRNAADNMLAVAVSASLGADALRQFLKIPEAKVMPIAVIGRSEALLKAGAYTCLRKLTPEAVEELRRVGRKMREVWSRAVVDPLTGCCSKDFWSEWAQGRDHFSVIMVDLDEFKQINDTYGHPAGDAVLRAFGEFLRLRVRPMDVVVRAGGDEFVIGLPHASAEDARKAAHRLREEWTKQGVLISHGNRVFPGFSWGAAHSSEGNVLALADQRMYRDKNRRKKAVKKVLLLGEASLLASELGAAGFGTTIDPRDALVCVCDLKSIGYAPKDVPLLVVGTGLVADLAVKRLRPEAKVVARAEVLDEIKRMLMHEELGLVQDPVRGEAEGGAAESVPAAGERSGKGGLVVLPGKKTEKGGTLPEHGVVFVACPGRPALAGEVAAGLARQVEGAALICGSAESTGALALGVTPEDLIFWDWRIPGSEAPVKVGSVTVWPVDPAKFLDVKNIPVHGLAEQVKQRFPLVVVDCGGNLSLCASVPRDAAVVVLRVGGDLSDHALEQWLRSYGGNALVFAPGEVPWLERAENGYVLSRSVG